jgi:hypothetical protein
MTLQRQALALIFPRYFCNNHVGNSIYIGGDNENSIPESIFRELLKNFPNTHELNKYASARISSILSLGYRSNII